MVRICIVIAVMLFAAATMYFGGAHMPRLLKDLSSSTGEQASKGAAESATTAEGSSTQTALATGASNELTGQIQPSVTQLDVSRISRDGPSVFAGHTTPFQTLTLMENGKPIASVKADVNGDWVLVTEHKFANADPRISFRTGAHTTVAGTPVPTAVARRSGERQQVKAEETRPNPAIVVMKRFEGLVNAAREEAKVRQETQRRANSDTEDRSAGAASVEREQETPSGLAPQLHAKAQSATSSATLAVTEPATSIPVPITFVYDKATLTSEGRRAAALLLEYLQLKAFRTVTLTGHADERGTHEYNLELSRQRLDAIERFLRNGGYKGRLDLIPKGEFEPFTAVDRTKYEREDLWQLDRRVELQGAQ